MKTNLLALALIAACAGTPKPTTAPEPAKPAAAKGLQIKLVSVYVDDQNKALKFYTDVLGFAKKDDVTNGPYRWLTVTAPGDGNGMQLQLAPLGDDAAKAYQQSLLKNGAPAVMLFTTDVKGDYERIKARGGELTMPPTEVMAGSVITMVKDTCGNLVQITQLAQ